MPETIWPGYDSARLPNGPVELRVTIKAYMSWPATVYKWAACSRFMLI